MLKKLKLALLATSVIFFPKAIYAADQDKDELKTLALRPASSDGRLAHSLLPVFPYEQDVDGQPFVGPSSSQLSSSQVGIGNSSSGADFSADQLPGWLTIRGRALYAEVLQSNVETIIDLTRYFNFSDYQDCRDARNVIFNINQLLDGEAKKPLEEIKKKREEEIKDQKVKPFGELFDLRMMLYDDKVSPEDFLLSCSNVLKNPKRSKLSLYIDLLQQEKFASVFRKKVINEDLTEAILADFLKEAPKNSRNLIERMAGPFFKLSNLRKSKKQIPLFSENFEIPPEILQLAVEKRQLHDGLSETREGWNLYVDVLRSNIGTNIDLKKYFNFSDIQGRKEAVETISIVMQLLTIDVEEPFKGVGIREQKLTQFFTNSEDQKELHLSVQNQLKKFSNYEVSTEDLLSFCSDALKDPKFRGGKLLLYLNIAQQAAFLGDSLDKEEDLEDFTEATLADILNEIPENSRYFIERMARPIFQMHNLSKSVEQALPPENNADLDQLQEATINNRRYLQLFQNEYEATSDSSSPSSNGTTSAEFAVPVNPASTSQAPFSSSNSSMHSVKTTFRTAGANPNAKNKHSAVAIQLSNQELQDDKYDLIINHRTRAEGPMVRIYNPITRTYKELGALPSSVDFRDTLFDITGWAKVVHDDSSPATEVKTYLSFMNGKSHIHSFKIQSMGTVLKEIVLGDAASESQSGVHVYGPETDRDANEWSAMQSEDLSE